jgi:serine/threonine-protein kinase RsbW
MFMALIPRRERVVFPSTAETVADVDVFLDQCLREAGFPDDLLADVAVSVSEVVNNAVIHGNRQDPTKSVEVDLDIKADRVLIAVQDEGQGFDPDKLPDPVARENLLREVGRGMFIVRAYMDEVHFDLIAGRGLRITLVKIVPDGSQG